MNRITMVTLSISGLLFSGCGGGPGDRSQQAPEIPPSSTMVIDFSDFSENSRTGQQVLPFSHWGWAATHAGIWNIILSGTLVVPVAAFVESFDHQPELRPDGAWAWSYEVPVAGIRHSARLEARGADSNIEWRMFVSREGGYQDFLWFEGQSNLINTAGTWTLNKDPEEPSEFLFIEWSRAQDDSTAEIKYTNIVPEGPGNGSYIDHGITDAGSFDAFYDLFNSQDDNLIRIEWNRHDKDGRVVDEQRFGDPDWRCWDGDLLDLDCQEGPAPTEP